MNPGEADSETPEHRLAEYSRLLRLAIDASVEPWLLETLRDRLGAPLWSEHHDIAARELAASCREQVGSGIERLFSLDIDEQSDTPLAILGRACVPANRLLIDAGTPPPRRDPMEESMNPGDIYGLAPATWADLGPEVVEAAISWGAAKAYVHLQRHA